MLFHHRLLEEPTDQVIAEQFLSLLRPKDRVNLKIDQSLNQMKDPTLISASTKKHLEHQKVNLTKIYRSSASLINKIESFPYLVKKQSTQQTISLYPNKNSRKKSPWTNPTQARASKKKVTNSRPPAGSPPTNTLSQESKATTSAPLPLTYK